MSSGKHAHGNPPEAELLQDELPETEGRIAIASDKALRHDRMEHFSLPRSKGLGGNMENGEIRHAYFQKWGSWRVSNLGKSGTRRKRFQEWECVSTKRKGSHCLWLRVLKKLEERF
jgi:hypothetical protein